MGHEGVRYEHTPHDFLKADLSISYNRVMARSKRIATLRRSALLLGIAFASLATPARSAPPDTIGVVFTPPAKQPGKSGYIELVHQRQETNLCVPTAASMVLNWYNVKLSPHDIKTLSRGQRPKPGKRFDDFTITLFPDLVTGLANAGIQWRVQTYPNDAAGGAKGLAEIRAAIDHGNPVLVDTTLYGGHTFVITGYDTAAQQVVIMDSNIPAPGLRVMSEADVAVIWNSTGVDSPVRAAIFTSPKR